MQFASYTTGYGPTFTGYGTGVAIVGPDGLMMPQPGITDWNTSMGSMLYSPGTPINPFASYPFGTAPFGAPLISQPELPTEKSNLEIELGAQLQEFKSMWRFMIDFKFLANLYLETVCPALMTFLPSQ